MRRTLRDMINTLRQPDQDIVDFSHSAARSPSIITVRFGTALVMIGNTEASTA